MRLAIVGGAGHVGLPLSLVLAEKGFDVVIIDNDIGKLERLECGEFPFKEESGPALLRKMKNKLRFSATYEPVADSDVIILTVGTPVDDHLNPQLSQLYKVIDQIKQYMRDGQVLLLRSTLFPGTSEKIHYILRSSGLNVGVSFCPERIAEGNAIKELREFPQIISGSDSASLRVAREIFSSFSAEIVELAMTEAELAKLFTNAWRYIKFAVANQFYMISQEKGLDFYRIRHGMMKNYRRAADFPIAGFAAGPCLFKDTMQLAAYNRQVFSVGHAAMLINETLPDFLVESLKRNRRLSGIRIGILGMAYKADSDDERESLAYKLRKLLQYENAIVMCTDPYIRDPSFFSIEEVLGSCELFFIGCPHSVYREISFEGREVVDCWGFTLSREKGFS